MQIAETWTAPHGEKGIGPASQPPPRLHLHARSMLYRLLTVAYIAAVAGLNIVRALPGEPPAARLRGVLREPAAPRAARTSAATRGDAL